MAFPLILKAKPVVEQITSDLTKKACLFKEQYPNKNISLKVLLVGDHPPSLLYTHHKKIFMERLGAHCEIINLASDCSAEIFLQAIREHAEDPEVHGLFVQLPLPSQLKSLNINELIAPHKDVDGFHPINLEKLMSNKANKALIACTPKGIITLLKHYKIPIARKEVVIIGRSMIVGKPLFHLFTNENATVTLTHSHTENLKEHTKRADIIVCAIGQARFLDSSFIGNKKPVVIDVGINKLEDGALFGDVDFEDLLAQEKVSAITPVPGGIGPMTIASLAQNLFQAYELQSK